MVEGKNAEAEKVLRDAIERDTRVLGADNGTTQLAIATLGNVLVAQGRYADVERALAPSIPLARHALGQESPSQLGLFFLSLGRARAALHQFPAAQDALLEAHENFERSPGAHAGTFPRRCMHAIVDLYTSWNRAAPGRGYDVKAAEWKTKADAMDAEAKRLDAAQAAGKSTGG